MTTILVIEDEEDDVILLRRTIGKAGIPCSVQSVSNGPEAIEYLNGIGVFGDRSLYPLPQLVLLDLKLPLISGLQILEWIRSHPTLSHLPIAVLTSSPLLADFNLARQRDIYAYLVKPPNAAAIRDVLLRVLAGNCGPWLAASCSDSPDVNRPAQ